MKVSRMMKTFQISLLVAVLAVSAAAQAVGPAPPYNLSGRWSFQLDPNDVGVTEHWFKRDLTDSINLPGILQAQSYGDEISTETPWVLSLYDRNWFLRSEYRAHAKQKPVRVPFLSQPPRHYLGPAWYQRELEISSDWQKRRVELTLERPHWETTVWLDDRKIGSNNSLVAPHVYDLGRVAPGKHRLTIRVDNQLIMPYRPDAHSVSDSLGSSWNGIVGRIGLETTSLVWLEDVHAFPNAAKKSVLFKVQIGNRSSLSGNGLLSAGGTTAFAKWNRQGGRAELEVSLGKGAKRWDEFSPELHTIKLKLTGDHADHERQVTFGLRDFRASGNQFLINGRPVIFRGTHHGGDFPLTGYPPTDVEYWNRLILLCQSWGLNHMRFHSFCPPEAAFIAADELGFYLQLEPGMWNEINPGSNMERMLYAETDRMIKAYGNHPSFLLLSASNEPKGRWQESLSKWVKHYREADPRRLYASGTGHTEREISNVDSGTDYLAIQRIGARMLRRESGWFGRDYGDSLKGINIPVIAHEVGQWVAYPDYDIITKFRGYLRPGNLEIFRDSMTAHALLEKNREFAWASGRYQLACYKEEIEANLRTPALSGFQLLDLHDYLGQGTALVGVLDPFWEQKSYVTAAEFRRFCNRTVPLARLTKRVFRNAETFEVDVEVAHYGAEPIQDALIGWKIIDSSNSVVSSGQWTSRTLNVGKNIPIGKLEMALSTLQAPAQYKLLVRIEEPTATIGPFENDWNFWVYPAEDKAAEPRDVLMTNVWAEAERRLLRGGKVLFVVNNANLDWTSPPLDTVPVFWNRQMSPGWSRMLGLLVNKDHPALAAFPSAASFDWQWAELVGNVRAVNLDRMPRALEPIVWAIDDWNRNYKLAVLFECKLGRGKLLVSSINFQDEADINPVMLQLRRSLLSYMGSARFQPLVSVTREQMSELFFDIRIMSRLGAVARAQELSANPPKNAIDGDPNTFWLAGDPTTATRPKDLIISFPEEIAISGLVVMPRQNHREHEGDIREYVVSVSNDGNEWLEVKRGELQSTFEPQRIHLSGRVATRHIKLTAFSGFGADKATALAELAVVYEGPKLSDTDSRSLKYERNKSATPDIDEGDVKAAPQRRISKPKRKRKRV